MSTPHYFIAIELSPFVKEKIENQKSSWQETLDFKQWTHKQDLHITLAFLGAVSEKVLAEIQTQMKEIIPAFPSVSIRINHIQTFGEKESPRIFWAGPNRGDEIQPLYDQVQKIIRSAGLKSEDRPFRPHITIAKKWQGSKKFHPPEDFVPFDMKVSSVCLYRIHPQETPKYEVVSQCRLR
ncbi:RNA 2',3'-cyclic phosphodiesterase [Jeotgalibacillus proteolyticus]|uniref:RNA 2',3'-cyclic phosphodiesterase n=1 Tax=Jeotgalibacillus proteolyticus TaxID=2082395 RepID=UPI003CF51A57